MGRGSEAGSLDDAGVKLHALQIPEGLDFVLIVRHPKTGNGNVEFHLQGLKEGVVAVHEGATCPMYQLMSQSNPTAAVQDIVLELFGKMLQNSPSPLRLS